MTLSEEMIEFRGRYNLTQQKAADMANITKQTWYGIENGIQTPSKLTESKIRLIMKGAKDETVNNTDQSV